MNEKMLRWMPEVFLARFTVSVISLILGSFNNDDGDTL